MTLLPKTDILTVKRHVRFTPKSGHLGNVRFMPIADINQTLFNHLVGGDQQAWRNGEVECLRRSHVDGCIEFGRGLYREVGGFVATQDARHRTPPA